MNKILLGISALTLASSALAEDLQTGHPNMYATHMIGLGASHQKADSELRASVLNLPEVKVDLDDLGVDDTDTSWFVDYRWRFAEKWMFVAVAYTFEESGGRVARRNFNFDGIEFEAGVAVDTAIEVDTYIADVLYSVYRSERAEVMVGGGLHMIDLEASLSSSISINENERRRETGSSDILAPLPNLRLQAFYAIDDRWGVAANMGWLSAKVDDYDGSFAYLHARVGYRFTDRFGVNLGYQYSDIELTQDSGRRESEYNVNFRGPTLSLTYRI